MDCCTDIDRLETWVKYKKKLCDACMAGCCSLPVEVKISDLVRMGLVCDFEAQFPPKEIAKKLKKMKIIEHFNFKEEKFTLSRMSNGDCLYLDQNTRRCRMYNLRPDTCRNHPQVGPRPGYCPHRKK